jgi:hypothetical protein
VTNKETFMLSHFETYKGWSVSVQVSAHLSRIDTDRELPDYIPRVVVTEHMERDFRDREIADGHSYPTMEACIAHGIQTAHEYIDRKT